MEQHIQHNSGPIADGDGRVFTAIVNQYCLEFSSWTRYMGISKYHEPLAKALRKSSLDLHLKINFPASGAAVFIPLVYFSEIGNHVFQFPGFAIDVEKDEVTGIDVTQFLELAVAEVQVLYPEWPPIDQALSSSHALAIAGQKIICHTALEERFFPVIERFKSMAMGDQSLLHDLATSWFRQYLNGIMEQPLTQSELDEVFLLVSFLGNQKILEEREMLKDVYLRLQSFLQQEHGEAIKTLLQQRRVEIKGDLFSCAGQYVRSVYNPLHQYFYSSKLLVPTSNAQVYYRYFAQEAVAISIRPFDLEKDLPMVHQWFHSDHAKTIWKMDWSLKALEDFYRTLLAEGISHSYIGEVNGEATFNFEIYWAARDILGDYYDVLPSDYGTHLFIAPTDKQKKFPSLITRTIVEWLFMQPEVGRLVGEGSVESRAALMNKVQVGFKLQHIIEMPHKKAYLNFCLREWYWEKFPQNHHHSLKTFINEHN
ncbi:GNAT family N-acetyltransferase [Pedobacter petrophilus]|uniref:GNAT family N-acetyltransferase n=1 Tax=Pedobacter petrophilus TaxID=1908241 RepID=A0A7K0G4L4_9SPHI|nr:GNAT family N-acetyltransferase [Pedobacter petrophilus]MRX78390.1 GNAT family N-acetyltransferase [Pedobacter petrophilus]